MSEEQRPQDKPGPAASSPVEDPGQQINRLVNQISRLLNNIYQDSRLLSVIQDENFTVLQAALNQAEEALGRDSQRVEAGRAILRVLQALKSGDAANMDDALEQAKGIGGLSNQAKTMLKELVGGFQINNTLTQVLALFQRNINLSSIEAENTFELRRGFIKGEENLGRESQRANLGKALINILEGLQLGEWAKVETAFTELTSITAQFPNLMNPQFVGILRERVAGVRIAKIIGNQIFGIFNHIAENMEVLSDISEEQTNALQNSLSAVEQFLRRESQRVGLAKSLVNMINALRSGNWNSSETLFSSITVSGLMDSEQLSALRGIIAEVRISKGIREVMELIEAIQENEEFLSTITQARIETLRNNLIGADKFRGRQRSRRVADALPILDQIEARLAELPEEQTPGEALPLNTATWIDDLEKAMNQGDEGIDRILRDDDAPDKPAPGASSPVSDQKITGIADVPGGIDFNPNNLNLSEEGQRFDFDSLDFPGILPDAVNGIRPVIINITPVVNFPVLLGLAVKEEEERLTRL
jgi:hypothetical protein